MRAEWQQVDNADGYRVTIYQQQNGGWVDTGFGYDLNKETTSIDMALTVGGEETAESKNLSANETYKVGVSAYTQTEDGAKYYSAETESSGVFLPEYTPLNLALSVNGKDCTPDENGFPCRDLRGSRQHYGHTHGYRCAHYIGRGKHLCHPRFYRHSDAPRKRREGPGRDRRVPAGKQGHHRPCADPFRPGFLRGQGCRQLPNHRHGGCRQQNPLRGK